MYTNIAHAMSFALDTLGSGNPANVRLVLDAMNANAARLMAVLASEADAVGVAIVNGPSSTLVTSSRLPTAMSPYLCSVLGAAFYERFLALVQGFEQLPAIERIPKVEHSIVDVDRHAGIVALGLLENVDYRLMSCCPPEMPAPAAPAPAAGPSLNAAFEHMDGSTHLRYTFYRSTQTTGVDIVTSTGLARSYASVGAAALSVIYKVALAHGLTHLTVSQWVPRDVRQVLFADAPTALVSLTVVMGAPPPLPNTGVELCDVFEYRGNGWTECHTRPTLNLTLPDDFGGGIEVDEDEIRTFMDTLFPREVELHNVDWRT